MTISVVVTETNINASVTQLSNSVALTETSINASVTQTPISVGVTTSPISASVVAASPISVSVTQTNISASISGGGGSGGVTDHALLTNLDYASAGHTGFQASLGFTPPPNTRSISTNAPLSGGGDLSADRTISISQAGAASDGYLSSVDWNTFNNKQGALTFPLAANLGGTGVANLVGSTLTLGGATTISVFGASLTDDIDAETARTTLGLVAGGTGDIWVEKAGDTMTGQLFVDGSADQIQLRVQGHSTQTNNIQTWERSDTTILANITNTGFDFPATTITEGWISQAGFMIWNTIGNYNLFIGRLTGNLTNSGTGRNLGIGQINNMRSLTTGYYNVALGSDVLDSVTEGHSNVGLGTYTLSTLTIGYYNMAIGYFALHDVVDGAYNVGIGSSAGRRITSGSYNVIIGASAGGYLTTNSNNVFIGSQAGSNTTGKENTIIGTSAGITNVAGERNVYIGKDSGNKGSGSNNVMLGFQAGYWETGSKKLYITAIALGANEAAERETDFIYGDMNLGATNHLQLNIATTTNNAVKESLRLQTRVSTASTGAANGFGNALTLFAETTTDGTYQQQGQVSTYWVDATNASRKATLALSAYDTAERKGFEVSTDGALPLARVFSALNYAAITPTVVAGDLYNDGGQTKHGSFTNGLAGWFERCIWSGYAEVTHTGVVTSQSMFTATAKGTRTLPANFWKTGKAIRVRLQGHYTTDVAAGNATIDIKFGTTTFRTTGSFALDNSVTDGFWALEFAIVCESTGATGTVNGVVSWIHSQTTGGTTPVHAQPTTSHTPVTLDTTASHVFDVQWTATDAGTVFHVDTARIWEVC